MKNISWEFVERPKSDEDFEVIFTKEDEEHEIIKTFSVDIICHAYYYKEADYENAPEFDYGIRYNKKCHDEEENSIIEYFIDSIEGDAISNLEF